MSNREREGLVQLCSFIDGCNLPGSTSQLVECHQIMFKLEVLLGPIFQKKKNARMLWHPSTKGSVPNISKNIYQEGVPKCKYIFFTSGYVFRCKNPFLAATAAQEAQLSVGGWVCVCICNLVCNIETLQHCNMATLLYATLRLCNFATLQL